MSKYYVTVFRNFSIKKICLQLEWDDTYALYEYFDSVMIYHKRFFGSSKSYSDLIKIDKYEGISKYDSFICSHNKTNVTLF